MCVVSGGMVVVHDHSEEEQLWSVSVSEMYIRAISAIPGDFFLGGLRRIGGGPLMTAGALGASFVRKMARRLEEAGLRNVLHSCDRRLT